MARRRPAEPTANPARGAALVVVAVLVGLFLLRNGLDTSEAVTTNPGEGRSDSSDSTDTDEGTDDTTTTTAPAARPPDQVPTIVLNDSGVGGAAKKYSDVLAGLTYQLTNPDGANADAEGDAATTIVYFAPGFEKEAAAVATAIGVPDLAPTALATPAPGPIAGASVVVVIGIDLANVTPTTVAGATDGGTSTTAAN